MHFGIFLEERRRGVSEGATLRETIDLADAGEAGGLDGVWLGEIHFNGNRSVQSAPLMLASFMYARMLYTHLLVSQDDRVVHSPPDRDGRRRHGLESCPHAPV